MSRLIVFVSLIALFAVSFFAIMQVMASAPAFSENERRPGIFGDWRVRAGAALHDASEYTLQLGYSYIHAEGIVPASQQSNYIENASDETAFGDATLKRRYAFSREASSSPLEMRTHGPGWLGPMPPWVTRLRRKTPWKHLGRLLHIISNWPSPD